MKTCEFLMLGNFFEQLLWVILIALIFPLIIQSLAANLGVTTGKHLSKLCKAGNPIFVKSCLWLLAELPFIAADVPEVVGATFALNILFSNRAGVLLTGFNTRLLLGLQRYGMILSFELPSALIPFLKLIRSSTKMSPHKNSIYIVLISWILGIAIIGINIYYLCTTFVGWIIHCPLPKVATVFIGVFVFALIMGIYIVSVKYLMFRKDSVVTFIEPTKFEFTHAQTHLKGRQTKRVHYKEDLADIPLSMFWLREKGERERKTQTWYGT